MKEFKAKPNPRMSLTLDGDVEVSFILPRSALEAFEELRDRELSLVVKPFSKRRSMSQNAYLWVLLGELSAKVGIPKEECYRHFIKDCGSYEVLPIRAEAVSKFKTAWASRGIGWVTEELRASKLEGYVNIIAYYGSSCYNSNEMRRLLDAVVDECKAQGIETLSIKDIMLLRNENDQTA